MDPAAQTQTQAAGSKVSISDAPDAGVTKIDRTGGVANGIIEKSNKELPEPTRDAIQHFERVIHETDANGTVTGWHKEAANPQQPAAGEDK